VDHAREVCRSIIRRGLEMRWIASAHPGFLDRELIELMRDAGCAAISLGCDSCSERMLEVLRKGFTLEQLRNAAETLEGLGINYILSLLIGAPGEDRQTVEESFEFLGKRSPMIVDLCVGIRLMPHTTLFDIAVREGVISADDPLMEPKFYISPQIEGWIEDYLKEVCATNKAYLLHGFTAPTPG
jgi:anaerobic magnesium-protoporphyrin IX monomethyl ester cyclase